MISLTPKAIAQIKQLIQQEPNPDKITGLRISIKAGGCSGYSYKLDFIKDAPSLQDKIFNFDNLTVVVDPKSLLFMSGMEVDYDGGLNGPGFIFTNPKAARGCGCGSSFSV
jgi:iron-sulfur cluster assembly protein